MRQPTFGRSRRRARQQRLLRTGFGVVVLVALIAVVVNLVGGDDTPSGEPTPPAVPQVAFDASFAGEGDERPNKGRVTEEGERIVAMLNDWYQRGFVDPARFGDGTFPEIAAMFDEQAQSQFVTDVNALTIGEARTEVARVEPERATATVTVYFENGTKPRFAVADVRFRAVGTLHDGALPLQIDQEATLHLRRTSKTWLVVWYTAEQNQRSIQPSPTPTGSA